MAIWRLSICAVFAAAAFSTTSEAELRIGSPAPAIDIEHWFHDKEPVAAFEEGKVYVIEFWATWCGPCVSSMPHLAEIQKRHAGDLTVIGVSDESPEKIEAFLEREQDDTTFEEITSHYWLTADPDGSMKQDYMRAANQGGIPTAFIVGKTGLIEWIGHPLQMDDPVAKVIAGDWDREAYAEQMAEEERIFAKLREIAMMARRKEFQQAKAELEATLEGVETPEMRQRVEGFRRQIEMQARRYAEQMAEWGMTAKQEQAAVSGLLEMAFLLESGKREEAFGLLERLEGEIDNPDVRGLLDRARARLAEQEKPAGE